MARDGNPTQLYLVLTVAAGSLSETESRIAAAEATNALTTVLLERDPINPMAPSDLASLVAAVQKRGIATLVAGDAALARVVKADGVHLPPGKTPTAAYKDARETLGTRFIVGVDAGRSRHDAMSLGEAGADYIGFGIPVHVEDRETARARRIELVDWWSEIFEVPCVAFDVETPQDARDMARAGADFVAVRLPADLRAADAVGFLAPFVAALAPTEPVT